MPHPLEQLRDDALREIGSAPDEQALESVRVKYLGKSGSVSAWGEQMKTLAKEEKPVIGKLLNDVRNAVTAAIEARAQQFRSQKESGALAKIDISLPGTPRDIARMATKCASEVAARYTKMAMNSSMKFENSPIKPSAKAKPWPISAATSVART